MGNDEFPHAGEFFLTDWMHGQRIGQVRVSRFDQTPARQVVVQALRDAGYADDSLLPHLSPLGWEYINRTGDYNWRQNKQVE